jgi:nucleotide-binding universal stress UspA family protein
MIELKRILCPVDFSEFSRHALQHAVVLARWYDSEITVFHAYFVPAPPVLFSGAPIPPPPEPPSRRPHDQIMSEMARFTEAAKASGVALRLEASPSSPVHSILETATSLPADLIVMGTHGRGGLDRFVTGSVTEKVLRKASCPVLTVPPPVAEVPAHVPVLFERILCPVDFSDSSMKALTYALSLAQEADAQLIVMHVVEGLPERSALLYERFDMSRYERAVSEDARDRLEKAIPEEARSWCKPEALMGSGKPYQEILRVARDRDAHLIVMGVHGRNPVDLMLFGSTTQHVVRRATCPVLTLRG